MRAPNVVSVAVVVALIALAQGLAEQLPILDEAWVPFAIVVLGALVKGLQVLLQDMKSEQYVMAERQPSKLRCWLVD